MWVKKVLAQQTTPADSKPLERAKETAGRNSHRLRREVVCVRQARAEQGRRGAEDQSLSKTSCIVPGAWTSWGAFTSAVFLLRVSTSGAKKTSSAGEKTSSTCASAAPRAGSGPPDGLWEEGLWAFSKPRVERRGVETEVWPVSTVFVSDFTLEVEADPVLQPSCFFTVNPRLCRKITCFVQTELQVVAVLNIKVGTLKRKLNTNFTKIKKNKRGTKRG